MIDDGGTAARHELLARIRDVLKAVRLFKNTLPPRRLSVPNGTLGILASVNDIAGPTDGCHVKDLAAHCALDPSTISRAVGALVRSGLVQRSADPTDGRASTLGLTSHGREVLSDVTGWYDDRLADALKDWSREDMAALSALLQRFCDDLMSRNHNPLEAAR
jgi:DNA-binding MarR family transcriptional regulator